MLPAAGVPAEEAAHDKNGAFLADTPDDTRLTLELLVMCCSTELTSDSEIPEADSVILLTMLRDTRAGIAIFFCKQAVCCKLAACSPDPLDTSSEELTVSGVEVGLVGVAIAAATYARGGYTADNL